VLSKFNNTSCREIM